jgi:muramoyltetrapeptide carboxypeptidase
VAVVATSGPPPLDRLDAGLAVLKGRYRVVEAPNLRQRQGYLAGDDEARFDGLRSALLDPTVRAVFCARGGYGLTRLLPRLGQLAPALRGDPKPLVGFSDITALHLWAYGIGVRTIHGPVVTQLGGLGPAPVADLFARIETSEPAPSWTDLEPLAVTQGRLHGPLVGGNLEVFSRFLGTPYLPPLDDVVLVLEDVDERPYRVDRLLTHLEQARVFDRVAAVLVGEMTRCDDPPTVPSGPEVVRSPGGPRVFAVEVLRERLARLACPVLLGAPVGHGAVNAPFVHGGDVELDVARGTLTFLQGAVNAL